MIVLFRNSIRKLGMNLLFNKKDRNQVVIFVGLQASGKTSFYNRYLSDYEHVNLDTQRTRFQEKRVVDECLVNEQSFVVDNTNPTKEERQRYIEPAKEKGYDVICVYFQSVLKDCIERNEARENRVPRLAIPSTSKRMEMPSYDEGFDEIYYVSMADDDFLMSDWRI